MTTEGFTNTERQEAINPNRWLASHGDVLWRYTMGRVRNPELAEELVQETLASAIESHAAFRGESSERTWLLSILRRKLIDHLRKQRRRVATDAAQLGETLDVMYTPDGWWRSDPGPAPSGVEADSREFLADLERCLAKLPAGLAEVFVLREVRGAASEAVCAAARITIDNLWVRMHRARLLLRRCMSRRWGPKRGKRR